RILRRIKKRISKSRRANPASTKDDSPSATDVGLRLKENISGAPRLPPELEREIFEMVVRCDWVEDWSRNSVWSMTLLLPLVCQRVRQWIEPLIYRKISILQPHNGAPTEALFLRTLASRPPSFFAAHVRTLYFHHGIESHVIQRALEVCTNASDVACSSTYAALAHLLSPFPITRLLVADVEGLTADSAPWCRNITHLGLSARLSAHPESLLTTFPSLAYLAVEWAAVSTPDESAAAAVIRGLMAAQDSQLRMLVLVTETKTDYRWAIQNLKEAGFDLKAARFHLHLRPVFDATWDCWPRRDSDLFAEAEASAIQGL
ncbi:unnamed protein product, partial [Mycena citricolor]